MEQIQTFLAHHQNELTYIGATASLFAIGAVIFFMGQLIYDWIVLAIDYYKTIDEEDLVPEYHITPIEPGEIVDVGGVTFDNQTGEVVNIKQEHPSRDQVLAGLDNLLSTMSPEDIEESFRRANLAKPL